MTPLEKFRADIEAGKAQARAVWIDQFGIDIADPSARDRISAAVRSGLTGSATPEVAARRIGAALKAA